MKVVYKSAMLLRRLNKGIVVSRNFAISKDMLKIDNNNWITTWGNIPSFQFSCQKCAETKPF